MLNIPEEIKTLFKRDDIFKNFHVHFPNGEYTDLNNDDIVSESVEFTESLCSQQAFRFGLTEASEIKFTCVNVPNIRGAVIECAIEVQADSLGAEWLADNAPTGNEEFLDPQLCTYSDRNMYRVPYGRFIVDTCPRNHETMYKRDVTGYTERMEDVATLNPFQTAVLNTIYPALNTISPYVRPLALAMLSKSAEDLTAQGYTVASTGTMRGVPTPAYEKEMITTGSTTKTYRISFYGDGVLSRESGDVATNIFVINWRSFFDIDYISEIADVLENELNIDPIATGYETTQELVVDLIGNGYLPRFWMNHGPESYDFSDIFIPKGSTVLYPYITPVAYNELIAVIPSEIRIYDADSAMTTPVKTISMNTVSYTLYEYTGTNALNAPISISSTLETERKNASGSITEKMYSFANAFSLGDIVQGYLELLCRFGSPARTGGMEITALDNTSPVSILPENYAELWYDETTIAPIGYVQVKFKDETDNEQDLTVQIGTGASVYDLRDNAVLQNMVFTVSKAEAEAGITIESKLLAFLNSVFTPNIPDLTFIPIELTKKGLPYLEAGDAVTITTGDGQVVPSFILRQTVKGIQFLTADVESANGEAVEMVET